MQLRDLKPGQKGVVKGFLPGNQEYRKKNHIHSRVSYISRVVGSNLEIYETTMVGSLYSQFDIIIPKVRKSLKLKN